MVLNFIWNISPDLLAFGPFQLKWITVLLVMGILLARRFLLWLYKKEGMSAADIGVVFSLMLIGAVLGARLVYVSVIDTGILLNRPAQILFPFEFSKGFKFVGGSQFSMLGAWLGIIVALFFYAKRKQSSFLWLLDKGVFLLILLLVFLRAGNFFQSEYMGRPTNAATGVVFANRIESGLQKLPCCAMRNPGGENPLDTVQVRSGKSMLHDGVGYTPLIAYLFFKDGATEQLVNEFLIGDVKTLLFELSDLIYEPGTEPLHYTIFVEGAANNYMARIQTIGIARHPLQLYEAVAFLLLFIVTAWYWNKNHLRLQPGLMAGVLIASVSGIHFLIEFLNDLSRPFIKGLPLTADQYLCIPLFVFGCLLLFKSSRSKTI